MPGRVPADVMIFKSEEDISYLNRLANMGYALSIVRDSDTVTEDIRNNWRGKGSNNVAIIFTNLADLVRKISCKMLISTIKDVNPRVKIIIVCPFFPALEEAEKECGPDKLLLWPLKIDDLDGGIQSLLPY